MSPALAPEVRALARAAAARRAGAARRLVARDEPWDAWREAMNALHLADPAAEARAARALAHAARNGRRPELAARFALLEARGLLRAGSPPAAARAFARAAAALRAVGEPARAAQAEVARVDALAHAGRPDEALRAARAASRRLTGRGLASWRAYLAINRANALRLMGALDAARADYESAARTLRRRGDAPGATIASLNAGVALLEAGDAAAAHERFVAAREAFTAQGRPDMAREARYDAACALVRLGRLGEAVRALSTLAAEHEQAALPRRAALCRMDLAEALLRAGDRDAGEREALAARRLFAAQRARAEEVEALWVAACAAGTRAPRRARTHLSVARRTARRLGRPALALRCDLLAADLELASGRSPRGLTTLARRARRLGQHEIAAQAALLAARADLEQGRPVAALARLAEPALRRSVDPWLLAAVATARALAHAQQGRTDAALRALEETCALRERAGRDLPGPWLRAHALLDALDPWLARVDLLLARGRPDDRRAAARVLDELATRRFAASGRAPAASTADAALRRRLEALYDRIARGQGPARGADAVAPETLVREARRLERRLAAGWRRRERASASTRTSPPRRAVASGRPVLHVWRRGARVRLLFCDAHLTEAQDGGAVAELESAAERLSFHARRLRQGGDARALEDELEALSSRLLATLGDTPPAELSLVIDPSLPDVPFEVLPWNGVPLAAVTRLLRVPDPARSAARGAPARGRAVLVLGEPDLPGAREESTVVRADEAPLTGAAATRTALDAAFGRAAVVHVAGHGFDAPDAPALAGVRLFDGWYGSADLPPRIKARLIVLAACRSGTAAGPAVQAWGGLPQALLASGARTVLWTADDIEDSVSLGLMRRLYAALDRGEDVRAAFGAALAAQAGDAGHVGALLPFRLSGLLPGWTA